MVLNLWDLLHFYLIHIDYNMDGITDDVRRLNLYFISHMELKINPSKILEG